MYNGIGLATARGSGTNGYVVKNLSLITRRPRPQTYTAEVQDQPDLLPYRKPDEGILLHEKKRQIEVKCLELQLQLEDQGLAEEEILVQVDKLRVKLLCALEKGREPKPTKVLKPSDTHQLAHAKKIENTKMMRALGISESIYVEGAAFDRERKLREKMLRETEIELQKARILQNAKLNRDKESDSDFSDSVSHKIRHHKKSKSKRKEKKRDQGSPPIQDPPSKEISSQAQPFVHPSRRHLQPSSPNKDSESTWALQGRDLHEPFCTHSGAHRNDRSPKYSGRSPSQRSKLPLCEAGSGRNVKDTLSRSSSRGRVAKHSISRSPRRGRSRDHTSRRSISRSPIRDGPRGRTSRWSVSRSPVRDGHGRRFRSPLCNGDRGRTGRVYAPRSPIRDGLRGRTSRRSVSRSPVNAGARSWSSGRSDSRSPVRSKFKSRGSRRSVSRSPRLEARGRSSGRPVSRSPINTGARSGSSDLSDSRSPIRSKFKSRGSRRSVSRSPRLEARGRFSRRSVSRSSSYSSSRSRRPRVRSRSFSTSSRSVSRSLGSDSGKRRSVREVSRSPILRR